MPEEFPPFVYEVSSLSRLFWREFAITFHTDELFSQGERLPGFASFTVEIFHRLYYEPAPEKLDPSPPESAWAEKLHNEFSEIIGFENLVRQCQGNQLAAGVATMEFCKTVLDRLPQPGYKLQDPQKLRDFIKQLKNSSQSPAKILKQMSTLNKQEKKALGELIRSVEDDTDEMLATLRLLGQSAVQDAEYYAQGLDSSEIRQTIRVAVAETEEKLSELTQWLEMIGLNWGIEEGTEQTVSSVEKMELASRIATNEKLKLIAKLSGSLKDIADKKRRTKTEDAFGELSSIELGNNLARLLPLELQKLTQPELFPLFAKGYYEHSLLQYKIVGKEKKSKGPLIVCLDSSGSMAGHPDTWAKAVTAVLLQIAHKDNRHFRVIHFDTRVRRTDDFPPKHHDYRKFLDSMLSFYSGGGTNWEPALFEAIKYIDNDQSLHKADIVLITDALCDMSQDVVEKLKSNKQHLQTNIFSILIGNHSEKNLTKFSDRIWVIKDLSFEASNQIEELFLI
ncbi:VWA domain-containing protein [Aulosira sp. FACHB-615]|nr:VWA domain-containing protein [Aulosira sp. FACHB-615]